MINSGITKLWVWREQFEYLKFSLNDHKPAEFGLVQEQFDSDLSVPVCVWFEISRFGLNTVWLIHWWVWFDSELAYKWRYIDPMVRKFEVLDSDLNCQE